MTSPARITILGLNYSPEHAGIAPYTAGFARHLAANGTRATAVTGFPHYPQWRRDPEFRGWRSDTVEDEVRLRRLSHWIPQPPRGVRRLLSELTFGLHQLAVSWNRPQITVFVSPALFSTALCMARSRILSRSRRVVWVQDLYSQGMNETGEGGGLAVRVAGTIERWTLRSADAVVAIHPAMADRMVESLAVERSKIHVVPNWSHVVVTHTDRDATRGTLGWRDSDFVVLHAGNMGRKQGLANVVEAARAAQAAASNVKFVLLGDGADRNALEALAADCTHISFVDPLDDSTFTAALQAADALLVNELPGVKEMAVPSKLTSYLAARRPVIASTAPDGIVASIMASAGAGPVVASGSPSALFEAAQSLAADPDAASAAGQAGHRYFEDNLTAAGAFAAWDDVLATVQKN